MNSAIKYGLYIACVAIAHKLMVFFLDKQMTPAGVYSSLLIFLFIFLFIFLGIKHKRDHHSKTSGTVLDANADAPGKSFTFKNALKHGFGIALISGIVFSFFIYFYYASIDDGYADRFIQRRGELMAEKKIAPDEIKKELTLLKQEVLTPFRQATTTLLFFTVIGVVCTFISSTFLLAKRDVTLQ